MDIANYEINSVKPILMQQAVEYEKAKFMDYLKENKGNKINIYNIACIQNNEKNI